MKDEPILRHHTPEIERALPPAVQLPALFKEPEKIDETLADIRRLALSYVPDLLTGEGRKAIASLAAKVARTKVLWDDVGKRITEDARREVLEVNGQRKKIRDTLDALKREVRQPLTDWEQQEHDRVADLRLRLKEFYSVLDGSWRETGREAVASKLGHLEGIPIDDTWDEFQSEAEGAKLEAINSLRNVMAGIERCEAEEVERQRREAEIARKEAEQAVKEAELQAAHARLEELERDRALEQVVKEREEAAVRRSQEEAQKREEELREVIARELIMARRVADSLPPAPGEQERRSRSGAEIRGEIMVALRDCVQSGTGAGLGVVAICELIADALMEGKIPHVFIDAP